MTNAINLAELPAPAVVQSLDYETILAAMLADLRGRAPAFTALVESDPAYKILEVAAYRELLLRQRVNDAAHAVMLAYSKGADLDNLAALFGVPRQVIDPGNPAALPPVAPVYEDDERLRQRIPLSLEGYSTAGPIGAYVYHSLAASADVKDVAVASPTPGAVVVSVLSVAGNGSATTALLNTVARHLNHDDIRPLTDHVTVLGASVLEYQVNATLIFYRGPGKSKIAAHARQQAGAYVTQQHKLGRDIPVSGLYAALHQSGVQNVIIASPAADIVVQPHQAAFCTNMTIIAGGWHE